ncbi:hypothetical protein COU54_04820 [Candidatus Pacearchaeota archaeon CG10_big_fil_rev_8_21_14_0_10_31_24]|nr:MAG: hypothetical protein COU54_04820 [Candidatus Pacearchaeota archaeon CG10_big_fil_rev_8_21_14_0_10_31_24]
MPETSIIIRTLNEERHLGNLLNALKNQDYQDYEIIIVDSGSTDRTLEVANEFSAQIIKIESRDFTFGYALNVGCKVSNGKYLVFVSAHVLPVNNQWLSNLIYPFQNSKIAMVYGRQMGDDNSKFSERMDLKRLFRDSAIDSGITLDYANNANSAIRSDLWKKNMFDEYLFGLEDIDWARAVIKMGHIIHYEPTAVVYHIHQEEWYQVFNRYRREAIAAVRIGLKHPPQAKKNILSVIRVTFLDLLLTFPDYSLNRLEEIIRFRYYQWKGTKTGWLRGIGLDLDVERNNIFRPIKNEAVVINSLGKAKLEEMQIPEMKPGDILIKVDYVGVCRTDLEVYEGTLGYYRDGLAKYPIVPGHEFSGTIVRIGSNNKFQERFKVGQKIVGECILSRGQDSERKEVGVINFNGAYSNYILTRGESLHRIPDNLDPKTAVLAEPLAVVLRALRRIDSRLPSKASIAIIGAGQIGNLCTQVLSQRGYDVSLYDKNIDRLRILEIEAKSIETELQKLEKFDVIIEATGSPEVLEQVLRDSCVNSTILLLGFPYGDINYNFESFVGKEQVIVGSVGADSQDFNEALKLLPKLKMEEFTKVIMPLADFAVAWNTHKSFKYLKIILQP